MGMGKLYEGRYMKAAQLDSPVVATIDYGEEALLETPDGKKDLKAVIHFQESDLKPLVLNKTNADRLWEIAGSDEPEALKGIRVELYVEKVRFGKDLVDGVRLRQAPADDVPF